MNPKGRHPSKRWSILKWVLQIAPKAIHILCINPYHWKDGKQTECGLLFDYARCEGLEFIANNIDLEPLECYTGAHLRIQWDVHVKTETLLLNILLNSQVSMEDRLVYANVSGGKSNIPLFKLLLEKYPNVLAIVTTKRRGGSNVFEELEKFATIKEKNHEGDAIYTVWLQPKC